VATILDGAQRYAGGARPREAEHGVLQAATFAD
jgi:hypothetical protein